MKQIMNGLGILMVGLGAALLIYLGIMCFTVINNPQDIQLVQFVLEHVRAGDAAFSGHMTDITTGRKMDFEINWSESVRTISFVFIGVTILGVLAGIAKVLVASGVGILKLCRDEKEA